MDWAKPLHDARPMCFDCHLDARGRLQGKMGWAEATRCGVPAVGMAPPLGARVSTDGIGMLLEHQFGLSGNTPPLAWPEQARQQ